MRTRISNNKKQVFDPIRGKWVRLSPEEHVRQQVIDFLVRDIQIPVTLIGVEYSLSNLEPGNRRQVDIVAWIPGDAKVQLVPWLLVECKAPSVPLTRAMERQLKHYLLAIPSQYVLLTNGPDNRYFHYQEGRYKPAGGLPPYPAHCKARS